MRWTIAKVYRLLIYKCSVYEKTNFVIFDASIPHIIFHASVVPCFMKLYRFYSVISAFLDSIACSLMLMYEAAYHFTVPNLCRITENVY